jgi:RNA polymerase sigma-70 factor, ECF subfamily
MAGGADLIRAMAAGDRAAFARFYDRYAALVYPIILRIVRDGPDASDVLHEVLWESWQHAPAYDPARGSPEAWLLTRARAQAIDRVRAGHRRGETFAAPIDGGAIAAPAPPDAAASADRSLVLRALEQLPDAQRAVIELAYYGGLTQSEIAAQLCQPLGTVKTQLRLGLERLREVVNR